MSQMGQTRTSPAATGTSVLPPQTDIVGQTSHVRKVPKPEVKLASTGCARPPGCAGRICRCLIISDLRLADGERGIEVIERLREALAAPIPAFVINGDTAPERLREARTFFHAGWNSSRWPPVTQTKTRLLGLRPQAPGFAEVVRENGSYFLELKSAKLDKSDFKNLGALGALLLG
jgi:hypothetical protein